MTQTVLLVDDDLSILHGLIRNWRKEAFRVRTATSAEEALAIFEQFPVDAVVCDWQMPGISGTEFLSRIAADYPQTVRIMLTGKPSFEIAQGAINNGSVHKFLTKPCDARLLAGVLNKALAAKQLVPQF